MATLLSFHAHPDDESIVTAGTIAKAVDAGHRVILVWATRGEHGEVEEGFLEAGEELWRRREDESRLSAEILGVHRFAFLDYVDSGMMGTPENDAPNSFWRADVEEAAGRLAAILGEESVDALTVYDDHGGYGHPDHIQVQRVGVRAAELAGTPAVFEATSNRDEAKRMMAAARERGMEMPADLDESWFDAFGTPERLLTTRVDVRPYLDRKRASMVAHASQIAESSFFLAMPPEAFEAWFGTEWYVHRGVPPGVREHDLFETSG
jgi:LmbE family N-acetylglucosaminyl deacetylase